MKSEIEALLQERSKTHGHYFAFAAVVQKLKDICAGYNYSSLSNEHRTSVDMIIMKLGRIITGNPEVKDHWDDIAGYATLGSKAVKDDRIEAVKSEGPKKAETQKPLSKGFTYPEVLTKSNQQPLGVSTRTFEGDVTG